MSGGRRVSLRQRQEWPVGALDFDDWMSKGWRPRPFRQFILKVHSRCNLACDYCYMYEMADQSWLDQPKTMSTKVIRQAAFRIKEHAVDNGVDDVHIVIHGGEPTLLGVENLKVLVQLIRQEMSNVRVEFGMQTNGLRFDRKFAEACIEADVTVGVSLDGDRQANDRHRRLRGGLSTYDQTVRAIEILNSDEFRSIYAGLISVIDIRNDPVETYEHLLQFAPPNLQLLLPDASWSVPPLGKERDKTASPYADWLIKLFDRWFDARTPETYLVLFAEIINSLCGYESQTEAIGTAPGLSLVIETNGELELVDNLKVAFDGAPVTGLHVNTNSLDEALRTPGIMARQIGINALSSLCRSCSLDSICGGGTYAHRYSEGSGFLNPSVYCADLYRLITHIRGRVNINFEETIHSQHT